MCQGRPTLQKFLSVYVHFTTTVLLSARSNVFCLILLNKICLFVVCFVIIFLMLFIYKSRQENPQKLTQLSPRSHPRHLVRKRTAQKDTIIDITSDSQVNSHFPYSWSPASLTFNKYFYSFLHLYITRTAINNNTPDLKSLKNQNRRAAFGRPAMKITEEFQLVCGRPTLALISALVLRHLVVWFA